MIVVDASVAIDFILGSGSPASDALTAHMSSGEVLSAPHLVDAEVGQGIRRFVLHGDLTGSEATSHLRDFLDMELIRYPHTDLLSRAFDLRANVTAYDGLYLALAETLDATFLTGDAGLADVPGCHARVEALATSD